MYRSGFSGQFSVLITPPPVGSRGSPAACNRRGAHQPLGVVTVDERPNLALGVSEIGEAMEPQASLLERPHEALDHPIALRLAHERRRVLNAEPPQLRPERMGGVLRAPVAAHAEPARHVLADARPKAQRTPW